MATDKTFRATVTPVGGDPLAVEYPADSQQPNIDAIKAAEKALGVPGFGRGATVEHHRDDAAAREPEPGFGPPRRVFLVAPGEEDAASVWVAVRDVGGRFVVMTTHRLPDLKPQPGWLVRGRGVSLTVESVDGEVLTCSGEVS